MVPELTGDPLDPKRMTATLAAPAPQDGWIDRTWPSWTGSGAPVLGMARSNLGRRQEPRPDRAILGASAHSAAVALVTRGVGRRKPDVLEQVPPTPGPSHAQFTTVRLRCLKTFGTLPELGVRSWALLVVAIVCGGQAATWWWPTRSAPWLWLAGLAPDLLVIVAGGSLQRLLATLGAVAGRPGVDRLAGMMMVTTKNHTDLAPTHWPRHYLRHTISHPGTHSHYTLARLTIPLGNGERKAKWCCWECG